MTAAATVALAITFRAPALLSRRCATLREQLHLAAFLLSPVTAVPVIVGFHSR
jgi:hypothetical protein